MGVVIMGSVMLMRCKEILTLVERKYFLKAFIAKTVLSLAFIPILWIGETQMNG